MIQGYVLVRPLLTCYTAGASQKVWFGQELVLNPGLQLCRLSSLLDGSVHPRKGGGRDRGRRRRRRRRRKKGGRERESRESRESGESRERGSSGKDSWTVSWNTCLKERQREREREKEENMYFCNRQPTLATPDSFVSVRQFLSW